MRQGATQKMLQLREGVSKAESLSPLPDVTESKHRISTCSGKIQWFTNPCKSSYKQISWLGT